MRGFIGVDLDGTLAHYDDWIGVHHIGDPVPAMMERVKRWLATGQKVKIFTARVSDGNEATRRYIEEWSLKHIGVVLEITHLKEMRMIELWDDRAITVEKNTGAIITATPRVP